MARMASARKQMTVEVKKKLFCPGYSSRKIAELFSRLNSIISRLVKRCDETRAKENGPRRTHYLGEKKTSVLIRHLYASTRFRGVCVQH